MAIFFMTFGDIIILRVEEKSGLGRNLSSAYIIYMLISLPLALYGFSKQAKKWKEMTDVDAMLKKYKQGSYIRLAIIGVGLIAGVLLVYALHSRSMIFCAAIEAIILYICKPSVRNAYKELELSNHNEDGISQ